MRRARSLFSEYAAKLRRLPEELCVAIEGIVDDDRALDSIAAHVSARVVEKQTILEAIGIEERAGLLCGLLEEEIKGLQLEAQVRARARNASRPIAKRGDDVGQDLQDALVQWSKTHNSAILRLRLLALVDRLGKKKDSEDSGS